MFRHVEISHIWCERHPRQATFTTVMVACLSPALAPLPIQRLQLREKPMGTLSTDDLILDKYRKIRSSVERVRMGFSLGTLFHLVIIHK